MKSIQPQLDTGLNALKIIVMSFREYPLRSLIVITTVCLAGIAESLGILLIIPLLNLSLAAKDYQSTVSMDGQSYEAQFFKFFETIQIEPSLPVLLGILVMLMVLKSILTLSANYFMGSVFAAVSTDMRIRLMRAIIGASWPFLTSKPSGLYASAMAQETHRAASAYISAWSLISSFVQAAFFFLASAAVSFEILGGGLLAGLFVLATLHFTVLMARRAGEQETEDMNSLVANLSDTMTGIKPLKAMGVEKRILPYLESKAWGVFNSRKKLALAATLQQNLSEPLMVVILAFGCYYAIEYMQMTIAHIAVIVIFFNRMMGRLSQMQKHYQGMSNYESAYRFVKNLTTEAEQSNITQAGATSDHPSLKQGIVLKDIGLSYETRPVFKNLNISFPANKITALIGPSGIGKTSIVDMITGLVRPQNGAILIDGKALTTLNLNEWHSLISYVPQELFLFHDTIRNNITLRNNGYSEADIWQALEQAGAAAFVKSQTDQLETMIGEKGSKLSGGQRQRIMIARALVRRPKLLILDEATTGLDPQTEAILLEVIKEIANHTTVIAVSHQPQLQAIAHQIIDVERLKSA